MRIAGLVKSSLIDYPGKIAAVIFVSGCNYKCFYCHNHLLKQGDSDHLPEAKVLEFLSRRIGLIDGVVISGGEPTLNADLPLLVEKIHNMGFCVKLDTNASNPDMVRSLVQQNMLDYVAVDYKATKKDYNKFCGADASAETALSTIEILKKHNVRYEVRTTLIPQIGPLQLEEIAKELPDLPRFVINRYRIPENYDPEDEELVNQPAAFVWDEKYIRDILQPIQPNVVI